jgi:hypothetical protein
VSLFDGKTLDGWKVGQNANVFQVRDGMIVMEYPATDQGYCFPGCFFTQRKPIWPWRSLAKQMSV